MPTYNGKQWELDATPAGFQSDTPSKTGSGPLDYIVENNGHNFGTLSLKGWKQIFPDGHPILALHEYAEPLPSLSGYFDSNYNGRGTSCVVLVPAAIFLPFGVLQNDIMLPFQISHGEGGWQWRVLKQSPHDGGINLLRGFIKKLSEEISVDYPYLVFPDLDRLRTKTATFSGCEDETLGWVSVNNTSLTLETDGGWLGIRTPFGGARILVDKLIFDPNKESPVISIIEGKEPEGNLPCMRITFDITTDKKQPVQIATIESVRMEPHWVIPSSQLDAPNPHPESSNDDSSLWVGGDDGWLHLENPPPPPALAEEARRWDVGSALTLGDNSSLSLYALLDQSGSKRLTMKFNYEGKISELTLEIESPVFEIESSAIRMRRGADLKCPSLPPGPTPKGEPLRLLAIANKDGALQLSKAKGEKLEVVLASKNENAILWTRPACPLVGPEDWAANDPHSNEALSALRALIPFQVANEIKLHEPKPQWKAITSADPSFPKWALGLVLLPIIQGDNSEQRLEWRIDSIKMVTEHIRYANPHQDAGFRWSVPPAKEGEQQPVPVPTEWTRVRDGYFKPKEPRRFTAKDLILFREIPRPEDLGETGQPANFNFTVAGQGSLFRRIRLSHEGQMVRASVVLDKWLQDRLNVLGLDWLPIAYGDDNGTPFQVVALHPPDGTEPGKQMDIHPALDGQVLQVSIDPFKLDAIKGSVALPARWLCHRVFQGKVPNGFVGVESREVSLSSNDPDRLTFDLKDIIYWFELDGVVFPIKSVDQVRLQLKGDAEPAVALTGAEGIDGPLLIKVIDGGYFINFLFQKRHAIAPGLLVDEEFTLYVDKGAERKLIFKRNSQNNPKLTEVGDDGSLSLAVQAYGLAEAQIHAVCQTGVYYVAWATECQGGEKEIEADLPGSGLKLGALTRMFLRLVRDGKTGALNAIEGMVGWRCPGLPGGYSNKWRARATFYARGDGKWDTVRLSGIWDAGDKSLVLWRHPFRVTREQGSETVTLKEPEPPKRQWAVVGRTSGNNTIYAFQKVEWGNEKLVFTGLVSTWKPTADKTRDLSIHVLPSLKVTVADAYQVRWGLQTDPLTNWIPPMTFQEDCPEWKHPFLPPESMLSSGESSSDWNADSRCIATTSSMKYGELLCPITKVEEPGNDWNDRSPKIWVFTDREGEEMALPGGLLGAAAGNKTEKLRHTAEQILAHIAWRKPAILETWGEEGPIWELVDPPTLNIFNSLDYFTKSVEVGLTSSVQRDVSLVPYIPNLIPTVPATLAEEPAVTTKNEKSDIPTLAADISFKDYTASTGVIRRYTPFEVGGKEPLLFPGTAWPYWPGDAEPESGAVSALGRTSLLMGCPRPGELQGHTIEEVLHASARQEARHTKLMGWEARAPRSKVQHTIGVLSDSNSGLQWWMDMKVPPMAPLANDNKSVVAVAGRPGKMEFNLGEWWALGWRISGDENDGEPKKRLVVRIERSAASTDTVAVELQVNDGDQSHAWTLDASPLSVALPVASREKPLLMRIHSSKPQETGWKVSFAVWSDTSSDGFKQLPGEPAPAFDNSNTHQLPDAFQVNGMNEGTSFIGKTPYLVGILSGERLLAYGPWRCEPLPFFPKDTKEIKWRAEGAWNGPVIDELKIWCMSPDGAEHWGAKS